MDEERFTHALVEWYRAGHRDLPWRRTRDPYRIWISEIMCQQTQVDTVVPRYERFVARFPDVATLASVGEETVCEEWAGLGYYSRARNLHRAACAVVREHAGAMPQTATELLKLPGIGRYTAGAIASIAYAEVTPVVDGNVGRVLSRVYRLDDVPTSPKGQRVLWERAAGLVPADGPGDFNQALMELGALVCTPKSPKCLLCPVRGDCAAYAEGDVDRFPTPKPRAKRKRLDVAFAWIESEAGVWLEQRGLDGLWAGLWELPSADGSSALAKRVGRKRLPKPLTVIEHTLSHRDVVASVYAVAAPDPVPEHWRQSAQPLGEPLSALARKAIQAVAPPELLEKRTSNRF
ncbi:MAG: A/G-specific adenine glycosylase [Myxococcota bacterium]